MHGLTNTPASMELLQQHYRNKGYQVINIISPSEKGLFPAPGSIQSYQYLDEQIPSGSVVIGHSYGGMHIEMYANLKYQDGLEDKNYYVTLGSPFAHPEYDAFNEGGVKIFRVGGEMDVWNFTNFDDTYDFTHEGGHGIDENIDGWIAGIDSALNEWDIAHGLIYDVIQDNLTELYGHQQDETGTYRWGE